MIKPIETEEEIVTIYPVAKQLRTHLDEDTFLELVLEAQVKQGYHMLGCYLEDKPVSFIGFMPMTTLYYGRFIWICDLVTDEQFRSKGYGKQLLTYVEEWSKEKGYHSVALSSGLSREDAQRFYEDKMNYEKVSYVYKRVLKK